MIVTGCVSNCCCESTIRDAMQMNYSMMLVADGDAARNDEDHNGAVADRYIFGCDVLTANEVIARLDASAAGAGA